MNNSTLAYELPPLPSYTLKPLPPLLPWISDKSLSLAAPVIAYWIFSMFFHFIDVNNLLPQYRLHTPAEVLKRNHATRYEVLRDVIVQHIIQTFFGIILNVTEPADVYGKEGYDVAVWATRIRKAQRALPMLCSLLGIDALSLSQNMAGSHPMIAGVFAGGRYPQLTQTFISEDGSGIATPAFAGWEMLFARAVYHFIVPGIQFFIATLIVDTWQYTLHRAMHTYPWLYSTFHSRHHRLYVPYAYGALYNHPVEGFLLDTLGTGIAFKVAGLTTRQGLCFFTGSTIKTVDDHCGYVLPFDPLQRMTSNNAGYHDIHHQSWGIKTNYAQPFFTFWDSLLGTQWTGGDVSARYERARLAAERMVAADNVNLPQMSVLQMPDNQGVEETGEDDVDVDAEAARKGVMTRSMKRAEKSARELRERVPKTLSLLS